MKKEVQEIPGACVDMYPCSACKPHRVETAAREYQWCMKKEVQEASGACDCRSPSDQQHLYKRNKDLKRNMF
jgi:hypothetical protein